MGRSRVGWVLVWGLLGASSGCLVPDPDPQAYADFGFGRPEQTFDSVRTAFQGEVLDWEFECFSLGFRSANGFSHQTYRAFRPELLERHPRLRWALSRAVLEECRHLGPRRVELRARVPVPLVGDPVLVLRLVREEWAELRVRRPRGEEVVAAAGGPGLGDLFESPDLLIDEAFAWLRLLLELPLEDEELARTFSRIDARREWKIDAIAIERRASE